MRMIAYHEPAN
jgi:hypothetical protein